MRNAFASAVEDLSDTYENLVMLAGDIGNRLFDGFKKKYPSRFFNCGVAEANMTGLAAGLASSGMRPITYTITPFNTIRCLEQIRLDICYPNLPVIIVGTGSGLSYAELGATHHSMEDIALMRAIPNMNIICPSDPIEVRLALAAALKASAPTYIRLGKKGEPIIHNQEPEFILGKGISIRKGADIAILGVGTMLKVALTTAEQLSRKGVEAEVISFHSIKPLDAELLQELFKSKRLVVSLEEHNLTGGVGSAILEWASDKKIDSNKLLRVGGPDRFLSACGAQHDALELIGLTPDQIEKSIFLRLK